jgi:hypothetical protein
MTTHDRDGSTQLVADVVDESSLRRNARLDAIEHPVDGADEPVQLVSLAA